VVLMDDEYWDGFIKWMSDILLKRGYIDKEDLKIFKVVNEPEEAVKIIENFYKK
jgi:predicted Rossmann-fold nucleotide-binding protein